MIAERAGFDLRWLKRTPVRSASGAARGQIRVRVAHHTVRLCNDDKGTNVSTAAVADGVGGAAKGKPQAPRLDDVTERISANPKYLELKRKRNVFGWTLTLAMMVVYYGYIALIAFNKPFLSQPMGTGVTTIGVPIGMGVILFTILITGYYVRRANSEFDALTRAILEEEVKK
jgi:uncharacterized membrane protein (DUF485 family)